MSKKINLLDIARGNKLTLEDMMTGYIDLLEVAVKKQHQKLEAPWMGNSHGAILLHLYLVGEMTMTEVAKRVKRRGSTVTVLVKKLKYYDYIKTRKDFQDQRIMHLSLTGKGIEHCESMEEFLVDVHCNLIEGISNEEILASIKLITKLSGNLLEYMDKD